MTARRWVPVWKVLIGRGSVSAPTEHHHVYPVGEAARPIAGAHARS